MPKKNIPNARKRIIEAAIKVFAANGFEGSSIAEVAQAAGVPKSLIYYHFDSKEAILEVLIRDFIEEFIGLLQIAQDDTHQTKAAAMPERMQHHYWDFAVKNADLIRIILMDSLKKSATKPVIYRIVEAMVATDEKFGLRDSADRSEYHERLVAEFFTNLIPTFSFLCFHDSWVNFFNIDKTEFNRIFMKVFMATHGAYHQNHP